MTHAKKLKKTIRARAYFFPGPGSGPVAIGWPASRQAR